MKMLKLDHDLAQSIIAGTKRSTLRLFDDKDISVGDAIELVDKADPDDQTSWRIIGVTKVEQVMEKFLGNMTDTDWEGHERYESDQEMYRKFQAFYGPSVGPETPVKIINFSFDPYKQPRRMESEPSLPKHTQIKLFGDGGSRGNPGPSAAGFVLLDMNDNVLLKSGVYLGVTTNNQAEYQSLKLGLDEAFKYGAREVAVHMDSMLVVNQMKGIFKVKNRDLWPIHQSIVESAKRFKKVTYTHVPREFNKLADSEVNQVLDAEAGK